MRKYIDLITENEKSSFTLAKECDPSNYNITGSLRQVERWKAKIIAGNSVGYTQDVGDWDDVGYVMINLHNNDIIPIARGDEHHTGFDLLYDMGVNTDHYCPLFNGNNYVYNQQDVDKMIVAATKWMSYGGGDFMIIGSNSLTGKALFASQLIDMNNMEYTIEPNKMSMIGEKLFDGFVGIADALSEARNEPMNIRKAQISYLKALDLVKLIKKIGYFRLPFEKTKTLTISDVMAIDKKILELKRNHDGDTYELEMLIFGPNGLKNGMHNAIRRDNKKSGNIVFTDSYKIFGPDLELAVSKFGTI